MLPDTTRSLMLHQGEAQRSASGYSRIRSRCWSEPQALHSAALCSRFKRSRDNQIFRCQVERTGVFQTGLLAQHLCEPRKAWFRSMHQQCPSFCGLRGKAQRYRTFSRCWSTGRKRFRFLFLCCTGAESWGNARESRKVIVDERLTGNRNNFPIGFQL